MLMFTTFPLLEKRASERFSEHRETRWNEATGNTNGAVGIILKTTMMRVPKAPAARAAYQPCAQFHGDRGDYVRFPLSVIANLASGQKFQQSLSGPYLTQLGQDFFRFWHYPSFH